MAIKLCFDQVGMGKNSRSKNVLDLHGYQKAEVADAVDRFLYKASQSGQPRVTIMTGKGAGIVQKEVIRYLKLGGYPWQYEVLESGQKNTGVLIVFTG